MSEGEKYLSTEQLDQLKYWLTGVNPTKLTRPLKIEFSCGDKGCNTRLTAETGAGVLVLELN